MPVTRELAAATGDGAVTAGVRPDGLTITDAEAPNSITASVEFVEELGSDGYVYGKLEDGERIVVRSHGRVHPPVGARFGLQIDPAHLHVFDGTTGDRL